MSEWKPNTESPLAYIASLESRIAELEALIKESKEPVAEVIEFVGDSMFTVRIDRPTNIGEFLFAAPVMKEKDNV